MEGSPQIYGQLVRLLEDKPEDWDYQSIQDNATCGGRKSAWPALCSSELEGKSDSWQRIQDEIGKICDPAELLKNLQESLTDKLSNKIETDALNEKLARIGLPLHYRLLRDAGCNGKDIRNWQAGSSIANEWGYEEGGQGPLSLAEAWWMWQRIFRPDQIKHIDKPVEIRIVAVSGQEGRIGTLSLSCIEWPEDAPKPPSGFVPHPESFVYCLDQKFRAAFSASHAYLTAQEVWQSGKVVLEWNISLTGDPVPSLHGGSIGAALALAAGALLARQQLASSPTPA